MKRLAICVLLILIIAFLCLPASAEPCDYTRPPKNVLVIFSYSPSYPSFDSLLDGLNEAFTDYNVHLQVEYMDSKLMDSESAEALLLQLLEEKMKLLKHIDMVITFDDNALVFIDKYYETLFGAGSSGSIPIVFSGCNDFETTESIFYAHKNITGQLEPSSRIKTIDVATRLIPDYTSITILVDNSTTAKGLKTQLMAENVNHYPLTFINSTEYTYSELEDMLSKLTPKDIFLFVACYVDSQGNKMTYSQSANFLYTTLNTPIFTTTAYEIDRVFAGGYVHDKTKSGYDTGKIACSILYDGITAESTGLMRDDNTNMSYMYNHRYTFEVRY